MISSLGDSGFSVFQAGHCDWQRPHSVQVVKSSRPFQVKSSIDADTEPGVLVEVLDVVEGDRLAVGDQRLDRTERHRPTTEEHVERRHEDVQVLGVQHEDQERQHHADVEQQAEPLEELQGACDSPSSTFPMPIERNAPLS